MGQLFDVYPRFDLQISRAKDAYIFDDKGQAYLDLYGGHGVISIGHSEDSYVQKLEQQLHQIAYYSNALVMPIQEELAAKLTQMSSYPDYKLFLCNSGAEANENALKLASFHTGRKKILAFKGSFHGRTAAALNVTDNPKLSAPINVDNYPVEWLNLNDEASLLHALQKEDVAAVIVEGIQGVGGLDMPSVDYLRKLRTYTHQYGSLLILDEIQSGFGRGGRFFAHQHADIEADIISMAKGMGNGFPTAGILIQPDIEAKHGMLGTTFGGNPLACAATLAVLEYMEKHNTMKYVNALSEKFSKKIKKLPGIKKMKGMGLMLGMEFDFPIKELRAKLVYEHHILTGSSANPNLLRILPPLNITESELLKLTQALSQ